MENLIAFVGTTGAFVALFGLLDLFIEDKLRFKISEYIFGIHEITFRDFENNVIHILMSPYVKESKLQPLKVLTRYSTLGALIFCVLLASSGGQNSNTIVNVILINLVLFCVLTIFSWPFDMWSLKVTSFLFLKKPRTFPISIFYIILDFAFTWAPAFLVAPIFKLFLWTVDLPGSEYFMLGAIGGLLASLLTSSLVTYLQIIVIGLGVSLRLLVKLTKLNTLIAMNSKTHEYPFTFLGLITGLLVAVISLI